MLYSHADRIISDCALPARAVHGIVNIATDRPQFSPQRQKAQLLDL